MKKLEISDRSQAETKAPNYQYACFETCGLMVAGYYLDKKLDADAYRKACLANGAINDKFSILDHEKLMTAAGISDRVVKIDKQPTVDKIKSCIDNDNPVIISLNGEHYELINGYDEFGFYIDDPGFQGDTNTDNSLEVFHLDASGDKVFSKGHNGSHRKITTILWFEKQ